MLLELLRRDLRLHWGSLVVPILILGMGLGAVVMADEGTRLTGLILETSFLIPMLPVIIHQRESAKGTLGDLLVLPVSRAAVVRLRYAEVLFFTGGLLLLAHAAVWVELSVAARHPIPMSVMSRDQFLGVGVLLIFWFAYPMPLFLGWGMKGLVVGYGSLITLVVTLAMTETDLHRFIDASMARPVAMALVLAGLFTLSYLLSLKFFSRRDF